MKKYGSKGDLKSTSNVFSVKIHPVVPEIDGVEIFGHAHFCRKKNLGLKSVEPLVRLTSNLRYCAVGSQVATIPSFIKI